MFKEILPIFKKMYEEKGDDLILDGYVLKKGTYYLIGDGRIQKLVITGNKKNEEQEVLDPLYKHFCLMDYYSNCVNANKYLNLPAKKLQSNNYFTLFFNASNLELILESELSNFYNSLKTLNRKAPNDLYTKMIQECGEIDIEEIDKKESYFKENLTTIIKDEIGTKNDIKIFFYAPVELYKRESLRYNMLYSFNKNDYNKNVDGEILGLPDFNMNLNVKKPSLAFRGNAPLLITIEECLEQKKFSEYLNTLFKNGVKGIYVGEDEIIPLSPFKETILSNFSGLYIELDKDTSGVILTNCHYLNSYNTKLSDFTVEDYIDSGNWNTKPNEISLKSVFKLQGYISRTLFYNNLVNNYYTPSDKIKIKLENKNEEQITKGNIIKYRECFIECLYKNKSVRLKSVIKNLKIDTTKQALLNGNVELAISRFNLGTSLEIYLGGVRMNYIDVKENIYNKLINDEDVILESNVEYFIATGLVASYLVNHSKAKNKKELLAPIYKATSSFMLINAVKTLFKRYSHDIHNAKLERLLASIYDYSNNTSDIKFDDGALMFGCLTSNIFYRSTKNTIEMESDLNEQ